MIVDTVFVGRWIGALAIGAVTIITPIVFLMSSLGMAIGIGGSSLVSRSLGAGDRDKANLTYGNKISLTILLSLTFIGMGMFFQKEILHLFGGKGEILPFASEYFTVVLYGVPGLAWAMMANPLIRALGFPKYAMITMIIPAILNIILDYVLIAHLEMGMTGAAIATAASYLISGLYTYIFLRLKNNDLQIELANLIPNWGIIKEISAIGGVTLARQGTISILAIVLHNSLFFYGGELAVSMYGIASRFMMFALFPIYGITQGFLPIAGYNYGASLWTRVQESISLSVKYSTLIAGVSFLIIMIFTGPIISIFTTDSELIRQTTPVMRMIFLATPLIAINQIGSAYYQAIGKAMPALFLTLTRQAIFLIPLILILPNIWGLSGIWYSFAIADIGAALISYYFLHRENKSIDKKVALSELSTI